MIARIGDRIFVSDLGSALGTIVNGQLIGHDFTKDTAPLHRGENLIVAGGRDSPFALSVSVSQKSTPATTRHSGLFDASNSVMPGGTVKRLSLLGGLA